MGAFNVYDLVGASAVVAAAEECGSSVMLQIHPAALRSPVGGAALAAGAPLDARPHILCSYKHVLWYRY